jgi:serine/threonine protein kinase
MRFGGLVLGAADNLVGEVLAGQKSKIEWTVVESLGATEGRTPGQFSVTYRCARPDGSLAFMKASDLTKVLDADPDDILGNILKATSAHNFERQVLEHCSGNAMDRVVTAIDFGSKQVTYAGKVDVLFYLIFELAEGDLRERVEKRPAFDLGWIVSALHDFAVGVRQLHGGDIFHNDIKPANGLVFGDQDNKIADLGRATTPHFAVAHEDSLCAGDRRFAPPEQLYPPGPVIQGFDKFALFRAGDLYNLGSLAHYLLTGRSVTIDVIGRLPPEMRPRWAGGGWTDHVGVVLDHWRARFIDLLTEASDALPDDWPEAMRPEFEKVVSLIRQLCEPDPRLRGHPLQIGKANQFDLQRYVTALDLQRKNLAVRFNDAKR